MEREKESERETQKERADQPEDESPSDQSSHLPPSHHTPLPPPPLSDAIVVVVVVGHGRVFQLYNAGRVGDIAGLKRCLEAKARLDGRDLQGWTALMFAASNGNLREAKHLVESGAKVDTRSNSGTTALMYAASGGHLNVVRLLLEQGKASTLPSDTLSNNVFSIAAESGSVPLVSSLVEYVCETDSLTKRLAFRGSPIYS